MNILLAGQAYYRRDNGQAVFTINLAEGLASAGHHVLVLAPSATRRSERWQERGVQIQTVPTLPLFNNTNVTAFAGGVINATLDQFQPDVVHIQDHYFLSRAVLKAAHARGILTVGTNHFLPENLTDNILRHGMFATLLQKPVEHLLWKTMLDVYNQLAAVTTPTATAAAILRSQGIQPPVSAISCGVDVNRFEPRATLDRSRMRQKYGLAPDKAILLYVGRIDREKGLDQLIQALALLERNDLQLAIGGKGAFRPELEELCAELNLQQKVVFLGFVPDADLPGLLNSVDIFAMPSHAELQSIATLEAMASGLPILAANARALPELVTPDVNGLLFSTTDVADTARAIEKLMRLRSQWGDMGAASRKRAEHHSHTQIIARYVAWYRTHRNNKMSAQSSAATPQMTMSLGSR